MPESDADPIAAIVLAAGTSTRMGETNKLLMEFGQSTVIESTLENIIASNATPVVLVCGHEKEKVISALGALRQQVVVVTNTDYLSGMTSSIKAGIRNVSEDVAGYMICHGDMPGLAQEHYDRIIGHFAKYYALDRQTIAVPYHMEIRANPVIFSDFYRDEILAWQYAEGCKGLILQHSHHEKPFLTSDDRYRLDIDTPADYHRQYK